MKIYSMYSFDSVNERMKPLLVDIHLKGVEMNMEVDTGAALSVISEIKWKDNFPAMKILY